jgi:hypothetical protein
MRTELRVSNIVYHRGTTRVTTTGATTAPLSISLETTGTKRSTSSLANRQAIDECGGICYPVRTPPGITLSNCILKFKGLVVDAQYVVAIQVEDFIDSSSDVSMSSVPVHFLLHVLEEPVCGLQFRECLPEI